MHTVSKCAFPGIVDKSSPPWTCHSSLQNKNLLLIFILIITKCLRKKYSNNIMKTPTKQIMDLYSCSTTNKMHLLSQIIYSCKTPYMFRRVFPSIVRSSKLHNTITGMRWNQFHLIPDSSRQQQLFDIYRCCTCICSFELLIMDGKTVRKHVERFTRINI